MTRASACGSSWLSVESRRVALATIATPSRADAPRRRPVAAVRHATAAEAPPTHWAGRQKARAALASATRLMSESDRASFAAYDVEFVVEISRCRAPLHRSTTQALRPAADVELYSSTALQSALHLYSSTALYTLHPLHPPSVLAVVPLVSISETAGGHEGRWECQPHNMPKNPAEYTPLYTLPTARPRVRVQPDRGSQPAIGR